MRRAFLRTCWLPLAVWIPTLIYLRPYDGWGAWAAAPLLLPSLVMSCAWGVWGVLLAGVHGWRSRRLDRPVALATAAAASEFLYYWIGSLARPY